MTIRKSINDKSLATKRFVGSEDVFLIPAEERLMTGLVTYVSGFSAALPSQTMALTLLPQWLCLSDKQGICYARILGGIRDVRVVEIPQFQTSVVDPDELDRQDLRPSSLALAIRIPLKVMQVELLLAVFHPCHAYEWLELIDHAWIIATSLSREEFEAKRKVEHDSHPRQA